MILGVLLRFSIEVESPEGSNEVLSSILSPSLPLATPEGSDGERMFLVIECIRATVESE